MMHMINIMLNHMHGGHSDIHISVNVSMATIVLVE